jgi:hypothetical protein
MKTLLLIALLAPLLAGPPIAPGSLRLEEYPVAYDLHWTTTEAGYTWDVWHNGEHVWTNPVWVHAGVDVKASIFDYAPGDALRLCATRDGATRCEIVGGYRVMLPVVQH